MTNLPQLSPENNRLQKEYYELKRRYSSLTLTFEEMRNHEGPHLSALYLSLLGNKKHQILSLQVEIKTLEMRRQLLQSYINRDTAPDLPAIDKKIAEMVAEYNQILAEEAQKLSDAKQLLEAPVLSPDDTAELKSLYRLLVKHLHPDTNPEQTDKDKELFLLVQTAYNCGDLEKLREAALALDPDKLLDTDTLKGDIAEYISQLKEKISALEQKIASLEAMFPFTLRDNLFDDEWVKNEQRKNDDTIAQLNEKRDYLRRIVEVMEEYEPQQS